MKILIVFLSIFFISACAHFIDSKEKPLLHEENLVGEHSVLASCVVKKLQSDSRWFMRILQFRNRQYPDINASEIYAYDTRYLHNIYSSNSPSNPDAILDYVDPNPEILPYARSTFYTGPAYAFGLMLKKAGDTTVNASIKGDPYVGDIAWKILQSCATSGAKP